MGYRGEWRLDPGGLGYMAITMSLTQHIAAVMMGH